MSSSIKFTDSYWNEELRQNHSNSDQIVRLENDHETDVLVVGAGFTGLSTAIEMKSHSPNIRVTIIESKKIGFGASGRNAGMLIPIAAPYWLLDGSLEKNRAIWAIKELKSRYELLSKKYATLDGGPTPASIYYCAPSSFAYASIKEISKKLSELGFEQEVLDTVETKRIIGEAARASLRLPCYSIHPAKFIQSLKNRALNLGVKIFEESPINSFSISSESCYAKSANGACISTKKLICSAGAWNKSLINNLKGRITESWMLATSEISTDELSQFGSSKDMVVRVKPNMPYRRIHSNRLILGGLDCQISQPSENGIIPEKIKIKLNILLRSYLRSGLSIDIDWIWRGSFHSYVTQTPRISFPNDNEKLIVISGISGTGLVWSLNMGALIAGLVDSTIDTDDDKELRAALNHTKFPLVGACKIYNKIVLNALLS